MIRLFRTLSSLKTGILLLVAITICALAGVVIPQGLEVQRYVHKWGPVAGSLLVSVGLDRLFSTLWYNILLGLFSLNVLLCTINRIRASVISLLHPGFLGADTIERFPLHAVVQSPFSVEQLRKRLIAFLRKRYFRVSVSAAGNTVLLDARRGALRDVGMALLHLSVLPLLIGGLIGQTGGFSYPQLLGKGEIAAVRERTFSVRCDYFRLELNEQGQIKDYKSKLTLLDSAGDSILSRVIEVNHPLVYKGIKFYQSSYRTDPLRVDSVRLVVRGSAVGSVGKGVVVVPGTPARISGTGLSVAVHRFIPDFWIDMETREPQSRSKEHNNPAFLISVADSADTLFKGWVFEKFGAMHHSDDTCSVALMTYGQQYATGLLIKENPGGPAIWAGIIFMSIGVLLVFWVTRRRLRIAITPAPSGSVFTVGTTPVRNDPDAEHVFNQTVSAFTAEFGIASKETANGTVD
ncbi:MAG: cytochrome c biogenesis protein ResB [Chitinispirillaceae bacterium]|nr:cytochrome c biogenesis protein ResB [Chitinispirillaceae bacterium]